MEDDTPTISNSATPIAANSVRYAKNNRSSSQHRLIGGNGGNTTTINGVVVDPVTAADANGAKRVRREASFRGGVSADKATPTGRSRAPAAMQAVEFYNSNVLNGSGGNNRETYKSLGDVYGTADGANMNSERKQVGKNISLPLNGHLPNGGQVKPARSITSMNVIQQGDHHTNVYKHMPVARNIQPVSAQQLHTPQRSAYASNSGVQRGLPNRFGNADMRASYNERMGRQQQRHQPLYQPSNHAGQRARMMVAPSASEMMPQQSNIYKSNGSLDIDHEVEMVQEVMTNVDHHHHHQGQGHYRREFGSHGSIDVITRQELTHHAFPDIRSFDSSSMDGVTVGGPGAVSTLQRKTTVGSETARSEDSAPGSVLSGGSLDDSPKQKKKSSFFSASKDKDGNGKSQKSLFKKFRGGSKDSDDKSGTAIDSTHLSDAANNGERLAEDRHRRRFFSHYDIGSVCATLSVSTQLKTLERRNTTTGASAASAALRNTTGQAADVEKDLGDNVSNELVLR